MAAMLHGRNSENVLHKKEKFSHRKKNLLFLPCDIAAMQNLYYLSIGCMNFVYNIYLISISNTVSDGATKNISSEY